MRSGKMTPAEYKKMDIIEPIANNIDDFVNKACHFTLNPDFRIEIENKIKNKKHLLFEEKESIETWKNMLINIINKKITIDLTKDILDFNQISKLKNIPSDNYHNMTLLSHLNCSTPLDNKPTNTQIISIIKNIDTSSLFNGNSF